MTTREPKRGQCKWILLPAIHRQPALYCGEPTGHYYATEGDGIRRRLYHTFCETHKQKLADLETQGSDDDE